MAEEAVCCEPVSHPRNSLILGPIQGISSISSLIATPCATNSQTIQTFARKFPGQPNREVSQTEQGIHKSKQRKFATSLGIATPIAQLLLSGIRLRPKSGEGDSQRRESSLLAKRALSLAVGHRRAVRHTRLGLPRADRSFRRSSPRHGPKTRHARRGGLAPRSLCSRHST